MMKKNPFMILLVLIAIISPAVHAGSSDVELVVSAIKYDIASGSSTLEQGIAFTDPSQAAISSEVEIFQSARGASGMGVTAFSWNYHGNIFGAVTLKLDVSPLRKSKTGGGYAYIPFTITFVCDSTNVMGYGIPYYSIMPLSNSNFTKSIYEQNGWYWVTNTYRYEYSDTITAMTGVSGSPVASLGSAVSSLTFSQNQASSQSVSVTYNMKTKSKVKRNNSSGYLNQSSYPSLCNTWSRLGTAYVTLNITNEGKLPSGEQLEYGRYDSTITVTLTMV